VLRLRPTKRAGSRFDLNQTERGKFKDALRPLILLRKSARRSLWKSKKIKKQSKEGAFIQSGARGVRWFCFETWRRRSWRKSKKNQSLVRLFQSPRVS
jgi:hypothetical protein